MTRSTEEDRRRRNEPRPICDMRAEREFTEQVLAVVPGVAGAALAHQATARAEKDYRRTQQIVRLMLPEIMRMEINESRRELVGKKGGQKIMSETAIEQVRREGEALGTWIRNMRAMQNIIEDIGFCGCGTNSWIEIIQILLERAAARKRITAPVESSFAAGEASEHWVEFAAKMLGRANLIEHGLNFTYSWTTAEGDLLLDFIRRYGTDDHDWPAEVFHSTDCPCGCEKALLDVDPRIVGPVGFGGSDCAALEPGAGDPAREPDAVIGPDEPLRLSVRTWPAEVEMRQAGYTRAPEACGHHRKAFYEGAWSCRECGVVLAGNGGSDALQR